MDSHTFQPKPHADYAGAIYGSELAGDVGYCDICNRPESEHTTDQPKVFHHLGSDPQGRNELTVFYRRGTDETYVWLKLITKPEELHYIIKTLEEQLTAWKIEVRRLQGLLMAFPKGISKP